MHSEGATLPPLRCCEAGDSKSDGARVEGEDCEERPQWTQDAGCCQTGCLFLGFLQKELYFMDTFCGYI